MTPNTETRSRQRYRYVQGEARKVAATSSGRSPNASKALRIGCTTNGIEYNTDAITSASNVKARVRSPKNLLHFCAQSHVQSHGIVQAAPSRRTGAHHQSGFRRASRVKRSLYARAVGYNYEAVKIFMPANRKEPVYAPYVEHVPPERHGYIGLVS